MDHIKHIFWDLDRTLWDFETNSHTMLEELFQGFELETKITASALEFIQTYKEINEACWALYREGKVTKEELRSMRFGRTFEQFGLMDAHLAEDFGLAYIEGSPKKTNLFAGTHEVLQALKGKYKMHVITNGFEEVQYIKLANSDLRKYFNVVVTSEQVGFKKPDSRVFEFALRQAGADATQSMMIGDSYVVDCVGGYRIGMQSVWFNPHRDHQEDRVDEILEIQSLPELLGILKVEGQ